MKDIKNILVFIFLVCGNFIFAQTQTQTFVSDLLDPAAANFSLIYGVEKIKGNPYLYEDWKKGEVLTTDGRKISLDEIKLDICSQKVVTRMNGKETWLNNYNIIAINLYESGNGFSTYLKTQNKDDEVVFAKIIAEGDYSLLSFPTKKFKKPNGQNDYSYGARDVKSPYFTDLDADYFLTYLNDNHEKVKLKVKDFEKKVQKKHSRLFKSFAKKLNMDIKTEEDAAKFLMLFNKEIDQRESTSEQN